MKDIYIFFDVDGVVATQRSLDLKWKDYMGEGPDKDFSKVLKEKNLDFPGLSFTDWPFDQECISNLHYYQRTFRERGYNVKYVITSSWRSGDIDEIKDIFIMKGLILCRIVGETKRSGKRGIEILDWLKENGVEDEVYLVFDDECKYDIDDYIEEKHLVNSSFNTGFDYNILRKAMYKTEELLK